jgi:1-deoxy-D-xylulose-5-phosphate reductoisomerase
VLNAANEEAVKSFLAREIPFSAILRSVERALEAFPGCGDTLDDMLLADRWTRDWIAASSGSLRPT